MGNVYREVVDVVSKQSSVIFRNGYGHAHETLTPEEVQLLIQGKIIVFEINGNEFSLSIGMQSEDDAVRYK